MRVLMVTTTPPYLPTHDRARLAPASLLAHLAARHALAVVTLDARAETPAQRAWAATLGVRTMRAPAGRLRHPLRSAPAEGLTALAAAVRRAAAEWRPDLVHLDGALLAPLATELPVPVVLACRESGVRRARQGRRRARRPHEWMRAQLDERIELEWERRWLPAAAACVVGSEADRRTLAERVPFDRIEVIPPGIDAQLYGFRRGGERGRLVFAGHLAWPAHRDAARRLATGVLPRVRRVLPRAELLIAGAGAGSALRALTASPGVRVAGATPDLRPTLWSATVALVPAEAAPGVDAALLESMALGTPVVAARSCLAGLDDILPGQHVLAAETDAETAAAIELVMREPVVAATLAASARQMIERRYTWAAVARCYESLWARVADTRPAAVAA
ncbi:MAG TPA: glycosyltransferase [Candidatus Acidoferrum sp.]|jgi:glycosyltransferase involved in cell wall biosynthesis|nr:glycosyltransferase [Candidatus Acidoferrum sp.]